jgi:hypothetical protein
MESGIGPGSDVAGGTGTDDSSIRSNTGSGSGSGSGSGYTRALVAGVGLMVFQQLCGVNAVLAVRLFFFFFSLFCHSLFY